MRSRFHSLLWSRRGRLRLPTALLVAALLALSLTAFRSETSAGNARAGDRAALTSSLPRLSARAEALLASTPKDIVYSASSDWWGCEDAADPTVSCQCLCRGYCEIENHSQVPHAFIIREQ